MDFEDNPLKKDILLACERTSLFLRQHFKVNITVSLAQLDELEAENNDEDFFEWDWVGEDAPLSETGFVLKLTFNDRNLAFCKADFDKNRVVIDAIERLKRKHNSKVRVPAMLCLVEACRQIGLALGKKGLTVECAASSTDSILRKQGYHIIPKDGCVEYPEWPVTREFIWPKFQR